MTRFCIMCGKEFELTNGLARAITCSVHRGPRKHDRKERTESFFTRGQIQAIGAAVSIVCEKYGVSLFDLSGPCRSMDLVWPRWQVMGLLRRIEGMSSTKVGWVFRRDHGTVLHAWKGIERESQTNHKRGQDWAGVIASFDRWMEDRYEAAQR